MASRRRPVKRVRNRNRKRPVWPVVLAAVLILAAAGSVFVYFNMPERRLARALSQGEKNLAEGDYTRAMHDFERALETDPANADAYTGMINVQGALGNAQGIHNAYTTALANLEQGRAEPVRMAAASRLFAIGDAFFAGGDYDDARSVAALLKDVDEAQAFTLTDKVVEATAPAVGSVITVGSLEYRVLERNGGTILLLSEKAADTRPFTETRIGVSWGYSTLRAWLNKDWINNELGLEEASHIASATVDNPAYPNDPESRAHSATEDRVFVLSVPELLRYFPSESDRATGYGYWTRTGTGRSDTKAVYVSENGAFSTGDVRDMTLSVRPAFWYTLH